MKEYIVTFSVVGEIHSLIFTDNIVNDRAREANAKIWINEYIQNELNIKDGTIYHIIDIKPTGK